MCYDLFMFCGHTRSPFSQYIFYSIQYTVSVELVQTVPIKLQHFLSVFETAIIDE